MHIKTIAAATGILFTALALEVRAGDPAPAGTPTTIVDIAGHPVPVVAGGLYDRYRSNPPLSVIAREAPDVDLSWFKTLHKQRLNLGFDTWSPNFYYRNTSITAVFTADLDRLRALMPEAVRKHVQPVQIWPGRGVVALTAYAYRYCDNDSYNEISLAIVTNKPGSASFGPLTVLGQTTSKSYWGYVLKLPVDTELARVRGVVAYNLPKWVTPITFTENGETVSVEMIDKETGKADFVLRGKKLKDLSSDIAMVTNSFTNITQDGQPTVGYAVSRQLKHGSSRNSDAASLVLGGGSLSSYLKSLKLGKLLKYEYVPELQSALYAPQPLGSVLRAR